MSRDDGFWGWRLIAERFMRTDGVVVSPPSLDENLGLPEVIEQFHVQQLIT